MTSWTSDIEKHKADKSILGFFAKSADLSSSTASAAPSSAAAPSSSTASAAPSSAAAPSSSTVTAAPSSSTFSAAPSSNNNNNNIRDLSSSSATAKEKPRPPPLQEACIKKTEDLKDEYNCINRKNFKTAEDTAKEKSLMKQIKEEENNSKRLKEGAKRAET